MRKRIILIAPILLAVLILAGCATLQQKWDKATDDERARIILSQTQKSLKTAFLTSKAFIDANPGRQAEWKGKVVPMFDAANKTIGDFIARGAAGEKFTPVQIMSVLGGRIKEITDILAGWGVKLAELEELQTKFTLVAALEPTERRS